MTRYVILAFVLALIICISVTFALPCNMSKAHADTVYFANGQSYTGDNYTGAAGTITTSSSVSGCSLHFELYDEVYNVTPTSIEVSTGSAAITFNFTKVGADISKLIYYRTGDRTGWWTYGYNSPLGQYRYHQVYVVTVYCTADNFGIANQTMLSDMANILTPIVQQSFAVTLSGLLPVVYSASGPAYFAVYAIEFYGFNPSLTYTVALCHTYNDPTSQVATLTVNEADLYTFAVISDDWSNVSIPLYVYIPILDLWDRNETQIYGQSYYDTWSSAGYGAGYTDGYDSGYSAGYDIGAATADVWPALLSAIPQTLLEITIGHYDDDAEEWTGGLFSVEVFGYNLRDLFLSLVSIVIIVNLIGIFLGGGKGGD